VRAGRIAELSNGSHSQQLPFGTGLGASVRFSELAVSPDQTEVAAISSDGTKLYVGSPDTSKPRVWYTSSGLASPTWDGIGDLWLLDHAGTGSPVIRRFMASAGDGSDAAAEMATVGTDEVSGPVRKISVSPDGIRCALLYGSAKGELAGIAVIHRGRTAISQPPQSGAQPLTLELEHFEPIMRQLVSVDDIVWSSPRTLTAVGEPGQSASPVIEQFYDDGSPTQVAPPAALPSTRVLAASDSASMLAELDQNGKQQIYGLSSEGTWSELVDGGSAPVYSG
jgi:hypothetical protein